MPVTAKRLSILVAAIAAAIGLAVFTGTATASTSGAHFTSASSSVDSSGTLVVTFSEAGLGNENVHYSLTGNSSATYACINGGGNHPKAANKQTTTTPVAAGTDLEPKNGHASGSITFGPPASTLTCPSGQTFVLACVSYTNLVVTDTTNNVSTPVPDASRTFYNIGSPC